MAEDWTTTNRLTTKRLEVTPKGQVGMVLLSIDNTPNYSPQIPLIGLAGWLVEEINGVLLVVDVR